MARPVPTQPPSTAHGALVQWLRAWWGLIDVSAAIVVLAFSPSSYRGAKRAILYWHVVRNTAPVLLGFSLLSAIATVVLTHIVLTTATSYGLTQFALQVVIRVLVLEIIPLAAALFVALRCTIPAATELAQMQGLPQTQTEVLPRVVAGMVAGITLTAQSCIVALVMAYTTAHGFNSAALPAYTRMFGQVMTPAVALIFVFKALLFCLTVSLIPMVSVLQVARQNRSPHLSSSVEMQAMVRMFMAILAVEVISLVGNYY